MKTKAGQTNLEFFKKKCREQGLKVTPQRTAIYQELSKAFDHPSIDAILNKVRVSMPNVSFDTVYRTVLSFADAGVINMIGGYGGAKRFDPDVTQHHHFRCVKCEGIIDFSNDYYDTIKIPAKVKRQFNVTTMKILLEGFCKECSKK